MRDRLRTARRFWPLCAAIFALFTIYGAHSASTATKSYQSTASMFFNVQSGSDATELNQASTYLERAMTSYTEVATSPLVLDPVVSSLHLNQTSSDLASELSITNPTQTSLLYITDTRADAHQAAQVANAVARQMVITVQQTSPTPQSAKKPIFTATVIALATPADATAGTSRLMTLAEFMVLGAVLALIAAWVASVLDNKVRTARDLSALDRPYIGHLPRLSRKTVAQLPGPVVGSETFDDAIRMVAETFIAHHPEALVGAQPPVRQSASAAMRVLVTSRLSGEGRSSVARSLAETLARKGMRVCLVDADLTNPDLSRVFGCTGASTPGLVDVLAGSSSLDEALIPTPTERLDLLPAGTLGTQNSGEVLGRIGLSQVLAGEHFDVVVIDGPALDGRSDAASLARSASAVLLVIEAGRSSAQDLQGSLERIELEMDAISILGNKIDRVA